MAIPLADLRPEFVVFMPGGVAAVDRAGARGLIFDCPKCRDHRIVCWDFSVGPEIAPGPGRWAIKGPDLDKLSLSGDGRATDSIKVRPCGWHGCIAYGEAIDVP
jgi:hypothetical protein